MARVPIPWKSSVSIRLVAPTDVVAIPPVVLDTVAGATSSFRVFDPAVDQVLSAAEAIGQTVWSVTNAALFKVGYGVELTQDDSSVVFGTLTAVDPVAGTITSNVATTVAAAAGNRVRRRLGNPITMTQYGTAALGRRDWGWQGALPSNHPGLVLDLEIDVEISFIGAVAGGKDLLRTLCLVVRPVEDCR
jgi:hypothetical protein